MEDSTPARGDAPASPVRRRRLSIKTLMFLLVLAVLLPAAAVSAWFLHVQLGQARAAAEAKVRLLVDNTIAALQLTLNDQRALMQRLAERPRVRALDAENFDPGVAEYLRMHPDYNNLGVRDRNARLVFSGRPGPASPPEKFREFPWFKEGIASGRFMAGDAFKGTLSGRWVTVLTQPVRGEHGEVIGLLNLSLDLLAMNQRLLGSVAPNTVVAVTDRHGRYLLRSSDPDVWLGQPAPNKAVKEFQGQREGFQSAAGPDGVTRLYAFATMGDTGWRVIAGVPEAEVLATYHALLQRGLVVGLGILLLALLAAWGVGRSIVGPIDALSRAARRAAGGDKLARAPVQGPAEVQAVACQFNHMVEGHAAHEAAQRGLEVQLRESQKMESIGTLAGGIAHDFNNILGAILGNLALVRDDLRPGHPALQSVEQINRASVRARHLVQQILAFSRRQPQTLVAQPLQPILEETVALLRSGVPAMVEFSTKLAHEPICARVDATQIQQVLMNLGTNSWHALQGRAGRIEVGLGVRPIVAGMSRVLSSLPDGRYAHVWVSDTGVGMDEATRARIFEPFFTTKAVGGGTGLGLSVVHGIMMAHQGGISVTSEVGKGTTVDLYFPVCTEAARSIDPTAVNAIADVVRGRGEHILYVDDDEFMRPVAQRLLQHAGWRASAVANMSDALKKLAVAPDSFDLVVTDFNMPGSSGLELAAQVARLHPGLPIVITSGHLSDELCRGARELGVHHLIQKENLFEELATVVQRVLSERWAVVPA